MGRITRRQIENNCNCIYCCHHHADSELHDHHVNKNNNCKVVSNLLLPEELMFYIFTLVPLDSLFNSTRFVCKSWDAIIDSSHFAQMYERSARSKHVGLYVENPTDGSHSYLLEFKDGLNGQFERSDLGIPQLGSIIGVCDGIMMLLTNCRRVFVVNPILKRWLRIPPFPIPMERIKVSRQCTIARVPGTAKFKLFLVDVLKISKAFWYVFYVLRIGIDESWKEIARKKAPRRWCLKWQPLYTGGNDIYWITIDEVFVMDVDKEIIVQEYPVPTVSMVENPIIPIFLWMGDHLSCIACKAELYKTYQIYILNFDLGKWFLYHEMGHFDRDVACVCHKLGILNVRNMVFRFWINDQIIFQVALPRHELARNTLSDKKLIHFGYNVKTKQLTYIEEIGVGHFEVWLHTISLVSLPSSPT
ncbi:unnamed protein product [Trifolium pratense]|uniref:Uncharacterized protein n=1 Tax=Trifolium pratense TaxID=57577 RepID=A0ACB0IDI1_TRIPR|nr:unnamed protein product [Trifolium pratense]